MRKWEGSGEKEKERKISFPKKSLLNHLMGKLSKRGVLPFKIERKEGHT